MPEGAGAVKTPEALSTYRHLENAPVTEALIDIRIAPVKFDGSLKERIAEALGPRYPQAGEQRTTSVVMKVGRESKSEDRGVTGFNFTSEDEKTVVQFRRDGFTFSKLRPYSSWGEILPEALQLWGEFVQQLDPPAATRIGVRYINHIRLPLADFKPGRYFESPVETPPGAPDFVSRYLQTMELRRPEDGAIVRVTQALQGSDSPSQLMFLLDIDASRTGAFTPVGSSIGDALAALRNLKNDVFFGHLTEEALDLFA